jgi:multisubunit Na+/H+ antiporter MnhC subunit
MTASFALIGLALAAAGVVGLLLPEAERLATVLPLITGAGVGILTLALGASGLQDPEDTQPLFLAGSVIGFATTMGALVVLWRRSSHAHREGVDERAK